MRLTTIQRLVVGAISLTLLLAGCGNSPQDSGNTTSDIAAVTSTALVRNAIAVRECGKLLKAITPNPDRIELQNWTDNGPETEYGIKKYFIYTVEVSIRGQPGFEEKYCKVSEHNDGRITAQLVPSQ